MAIKFATSSLSATETNLYKIEKFNGVDYTTTPTQVDDSRAIEMSNYLPEGDALVKRYGTKMVDTLIIDNKKQTIFNIWKYGPVSEGDCYVLYVGEETSNGYYSNFKIVCVSVTKGQEINFNYYPQVITLKNQYGNDIPFTSSNVKLEDVYSYGIQYEKRLFLFLQDKYLMFYGDMKRNGGFLEYEFYLKEVKDEAYIPTIVSGLGPQEMYYIYEIAKEVEGDLTYIGDRVEHSFKASNLEQVNLLRNTVILELNCVAPTKNDEYGFASIYNIGQFLPTNTTIDRIELTISNSRIERKVRLEYSNNYIYDNVYENSGDYAFLWNTSKEYKNKVGLNTDLAFLTHYTQLQSSNDYMFTYSIEGKDFSSNEVINLTMEISYSYDDGTNPSELVEKMRFGTMYGSSGYNDKLFVTGNPNFPNVDIRTCDALYADESWKDLSYFGDNEYHALGSSDSKIVGYGILNNGYMAIIKENEGGQPNLFFRNHEYSTDAEGNTNEMFPVINSGVLLEINKYSKLINYGNDLLVSTNDGLYKILAGSSTASQTYEVVEMSYFIRNNIDKDTSNNDLIVFKNKLYWVKQDVDGNNRVYVADKDRYGVVNGNQVYEWWALDGINPRKMFVFNNKLYFVNEKGLFTFSNNFVDEYELYITDVKVGNTYQSSEVFVDNDDEQIIVAETSLVFKDIMQSENIQKAYQNFKETTLISFDGNLFIETGITAVTITESETKEGKLEFKFECSQEIYDMIISCVFNSFSNGDVTAYYNGSSYIFDEFKKDVEFEETTVKFEIYATLSSTDGTLNDGKLYFRENSNKNIYYEIDEIYTLHDNTIYPFSKCIYEDNRVFYVGEGQYIELGEEDKVYFTNIKLKFDDLPINFTVADTLLHVKIKLRNNIESHWKSKYTALGREDYLKTAEMITFVAESRRGGKTRVGYRTLKKSSSYETELLRKNFDFNYLDFDSFSFSNGSFAQTHTAKKKIKNFSFMQIIMESNDRDDSTINSLSIKYKITKNNKGVR